MGSEKKGVRKWILGIITTIGTIIAVEAVGLGQILASALTAPTPEAANVWWTTGGILLIGLTTLEIVVKKREGSK